MSLERAAAQAFLDESDQQAGMRDIHVRYLGDDPERAYKIHDSRTKVVGDDGMIGQMDTGEFIGGVVYALAEQHNLKEPVSALDICVHLGKLLGERQATTALLNSASRAAIRSAQGNVIPASWLEAHQQATN